jgi:putative membrane protein
MLGWGWMHGGYGLPLWWLGAGFRLLFLAAVVVGIIFLARSFGRQGRSGHPQESALEILQKRYARGEISKEELEEMKRNLG